MGAAEVIEILQGLGVKVKAQGGKLLLEPGSRVPSDLVPEIRQHKQEILEMLAEPLLADDSTALLLSWASQAAETGLTLGEPVRFQETPLRPYTTAQVGRYCRDQLKYLSLARSNRATGGWGRFTSEWWQDMEARALQALSAIKAAMDETGQSPYGLDPNEVRGLKQ
jgi:hypothetical protein